MKTVSSLENQGEHAVEAESRDPYTLHKLKTAYYPPFCPPSRYRNGLRPNAQLSNTMTKTFPFEHTEISPVIMH